MNDRNLLLRSGHQESQNSQNSHRSARRREPQARAGKANRQPSYISAGQYPIIGFISTRIRFGTRVKLTMSCFRATMLFSDSGPVQVQYFKSLTPSTNGKKRCQLCLFAIFSIPDRAKLS